MLYCPAGALIRLFRRGENRVLSNFTAVSGALCGTVYTTLMSKPIITELAENIFYIENAVPLHKEVVELLDLADGSDDFHKIVPAQWAEWVHGNPESKVDENGSSYIDFQSRTDPQAFAGGQKLIDWDFTINEHNDLWPRIEVSKDYSAAHEAASVLIDKIDGPYRDALRMWSEASGVAFPEKWVSKNYTIKKYRVGGDIGEHPDRNPENSQDTMDWTALIYLTGDYEGGELTFIDKDLTIKPSAGSVVIFPCDEWHSAAPVISGNKMFIFMYIHSVYGISNSIKEFSWPTIEAMQRYGEAK